MILLCGIPSDPCLDLVATQLEALAQPYLWFNQRKFGSMTLKIELIEGNLTGTLHLADQAYDIRLFNGIYLRLMDNQLLPEVKAEPLHSLVRASCQALHDTLLQWCEITPARVINRSGPMGSNSSKPYQLQLIKDHGFAIPDTLITNEPELVYDFYKQHQEVIYKSISGVRSIVQKLKVEDLSRLNQILLCPVQFQEFIPGINLRVHVIGEEVFATAIQTEATDYRYAERQGSFAHLRAVKLSASLAQRCIELCRALDLTFAGIDLKITPDNQIFCFEVNPAPFYSYFEINAHEPIIARAIARHLTA
jgi:hypothetical protein